MLVGGGAEILAIISLRNAPKIIFSLVTDSCNVITVYFKPGVILHWWVSMAAADQSDIVSRIYHC